MSAKILSITLLLLIVCSELSPADSRLVHKRAPPPCCVAVGNDDISSQVTGETYSVQPAHGQCVKAIKFNTNHGQVCVDPRAEWAKQLITTMRKV